MKNAERIVMVSLLITLVGGGVWFYVAVQNEQNTVIDAVAGGEYERPLEQVFAEATKEDWQIVYPQVVPMRIGEAVVQASVADSLPERIKGLSGTPFLPDNVVKLFVFNAYGEHSIWMKDMNYALDIIWVAKEGEIVHIEENIAPETYPEAFSSPEPAWFVIEANAGFVASNTVALGDKVVLPR